MWLLDIKFPRFLLEDDLMAGTAGSTTQASKNGSRQSLGCLEVIERLGADVDADDVAFSFDDNAGFGSSGWH
jgi:hypothetical protein